MYTDYNDDDDWGEFFLMDLCIKFCASLALFFQYLPAKLKFSPILRISKSWLETFISLAPRRRHIF
jgi:hypothetical protein